MKSGMSASQAFPFLFKMPCNTCDTFLAAPARGNFFLFCAHDCAEQTAVFTNLECSICKHYHDKDVSCKERDEMQEHVGDTEDSWWRVTYLDVAHWHESTPCWMCCTPEHYHHGEACYETDCKPCPVCDGRMDPGEWFGAACSRSCFNDR